MATGEEMMVRFGIKKLKINDLEYYFTWKTGGKIKPLLFIGKCDYHSSMFYFQLSVPYLFSINLYRDQTDVELNL